MYLIERRYEEENPEHRPDLNFLRSTPHSDSPSDALDHRSAGSDTLGAWRRSLIQLSARREASRRSQAGDVTDSSRDHLAELADLLTIAMQVRSDVHPGDPVPGSPARREMDMAVAELGTNQPVRRTIFLSDLWTLIAADLLQGVGVILADGTTVCGIFPLLRASIEHSAAVCWILDNQVDSRDRARRAALAELRGRTELASVAKKWDPTHPATAAAMADRDLVRASIERDFTELDVGAGTIDGIPLARPTEMIEHMANCTGDDSRSWVGIYDYLCGTANHPSVLASEFIELDDHGHPGLTINRSMIDRLLRAGLVPFAHALHHWAGYVGMSQDPIRPFEARIEAALRP